MLLGEDAAGLSATNIAVTASWDEEYQAFRGRDLRRATTCTCGSTGSTSTSEEDRLCTLVLIGVRADGTKELVALEDGYRESAESASVRGTWPAGDAGAGGGGGRRLLDGGAGRVAGDGAERDWCHKLANVASCRSGRMLRDVMYAPTKTEAETAMRRVRGRVRGPKATVCLVEDQEVLLTIQPSTGPTCGRPT